MKILFRKAVPVVIIFILISIFSTTKLHAQVNTPEGEIWLLIRGDDIGVSHATNMGFVESYKNGVLTSVELMVPPSWFPEAVKILNDNSELDAGIHLTLTSEWFNYRWRPVGPVPEGGLSFTSPEGYFHYRTRPNPIFDTLYKEKPYSFLESEPDLTEVEKELRAQIELAIKYVPHLSHMSAHMGAAVATQELRTMVEKLGKEYGLVPTWYFIKEDGSNHLSACNEEQLVSFLEKITPGFWHIVLHPSFDYPEMEPMYSYLYSGSEDRPYNRIDHTRALTSEKVREIIHKRNIKLVSYREIIEKGLLRPVKGSTLY